MMEVILRQRIEKLGQMGEVVQVKPGYARNFLIPRGMAFRASEEKIAEFESQKVQLEAHNLKLRKEAEKISEKMKGLKLIVIRQAGESGHLYGSVRPQDVAEGLIEAGFTVQRTQISIDHPIKELGLHPIKVTLHPEVFVQVILNVAPSEEEAKAQELEALNPKKKEETESASE